MRQCTNNTLINQKPYTITDGVLNDEAAQLDYDRSLIFDQFHPKMMEWLKTSIKKEQVGHDILEYQYRLLELNNLIYLAVEYKNSTTYPDIACIVTKYRKLWASEGFYLDFVAVLSSIGVDYVNIITSGNSIVPINIIELEDSNSLEGFILLES